MASDENEGEDRVRVHHAGVGEADGDEQRGEGAPHEDFAVGEVDHEQDAVDERVAERDEGVDAPQRDAGDDEVLPLLRREATLLERQEGADDGQRENAAPEQPEEQGDEVEAPAADGHSGSRSAVVVNLNRCG